MKIDYKETNWLLILLVTVIFLSDCNSITFWREEQCSYGHFPCFMDGFELPPNISGKCVEQKQNCDGVLDCPNGNDEENCKDQHADDLINKMFAKRPDEDSEKKNGSCNLQVDDASGVPIECVCVDTSLYCENKGWKTIPDKLPNNIDHIDLSGNYFPVFNFSISTKRLTELKIIIMSHCQVYELVPGVLGNMNNLIKLYINDNKLNVLEEDSFLGNDHLQLLDLGQNAISLFTSNTFRGLKELRELNLRNNQIKTLQPFTFQELTALQTLYLDSNRLTSLEENSFQHLNLITLSVMNNMIKYIDTKALLPLGNLRYLYLSRNYLETIQEGTFSNQTELLHLDLNGNFLWEIQDGVFDPLIKLESLDLEKNPFIRLTNRSLFRRLQKLEHIYFDEFSQCSMALFVRDCNPKGDGISSLKHMLDNILLRICVWIMGICGCVGNILVLIGRIVFREPNAVHSFYIKNLALADLCMGVYLLFIAAYDQTYRGEFIIHEEDWKRSWQCGLCGFLSTLSSEASVLILCVITLDRYLSIMRPFSQTRHTLRTACLYMLLLWTIALTLAVLPLTGLSYWETGFYGTNGVCLPLYIHQPYAPGWQYSAVLFLVLNPIAVVLMGYSYTRMLLVIRSSSGPALRSNQEKQDRLVAKRFAFIVSTDCICWTPIVLVKIIALTGVAIPPTLYAWIAVFILPVNSALNPVIYTLTTKLFKQQFTKLVCSYRTTRASTRTHEDSSLAPSYALLHRARMRSSNGNTHQNTCTTSLQSSLKCNSVKYITRSNSTNMPRSNSTTMVQINSTNMPRSNSTNLIRNNPLIMTINNK